MTLPCLGASVQSGPAACDVTVEKTAGDRIHGWFTDALRAVQCDRQRIESVQVVECEVEKCEAHEKQQDALLMGPQESDDDGYPEHHRSVTQDVPEMLRIASEGNDIETEKALQHREEILQWMGHPYALQQRDFRLRDPRTQKTERHDQHHGWTDHARQKSLPYMEDRLCILEKETADQKKDGDRRARKHIHQERTVTERRATECIQSYVNDDDHKAGDDPQKFDPPVPRTLDLIHIILTPFRLKPVTKYMALIIA